MKVWTHATPQGRRREIWRQKTAKVNRNVSKRDPLTMTFKQTHSPNRRWSCGIIKCRVQTQQLLRNLAQFNSVHNGNYSSITTQIEIRRNSLCAMVSDAVSLSHSCKKWADENVFPTENKRETASREERYSRI